MSRRKPEAAFTNKMRRSFKNLGYWFYKIPDTTGQKFTPGKPSDVFINMRGVAMLAEFKWMDWTDGDSGLSRKAIREGQIDGLNDFQAAGGLSYVFLGLRAARGEIRAYMWDWGELEGMFKKHNGVIPRTVLESLPYIIEKDDTYNIGNAIEKIIDDFFFRHLID